MKSEWPPRASGSGVACKVGVVHVTEKARARGGVRYILRCTWTCSLASDNTYIIGPLFNSTVTLRRGLNLKTQKQTNKQTNTQTNTQLDSFKQNHDENSDHDERWLRTYTSFFAWATGCLCLYMYFDAEDFP